MKQRKEIYDFLGQPIGSITTDEFGHSEVHDFYGTPLGSSDDRGTRTFLGTPISNQNAPELLFDKKR